ncbi:PRC-barrel domain-containing protein [Streptomyces thermolineatus]|uniref:PRC-barrel domain-containing protein n=1 Tax=Streptomyces thermolineatus TaxID=44033 RepID=UPI00384D87B8
MSTQIRPDDVIGHKAVDVEGNKIGSVEQVFVSDTTGSPEWVTVKRGLFRSKEIFVPLRGASMSGDQLRLAYLKEKVSGAPDLEVGRHLSVEEEQELYRYYGLSTTGPGRPGEAGAGGGGPGTSAAGPGAARAPPAPPTPAQPRAPPAARAPRRVRAPSPSRGGTWRAGTGPRTFPATRARTSPDCRSGTPPDCTAPRTPGA